MNSKYLVIALIFITFESVLSGGRSFHSTITSRQIADLYKETIATNSTRSKRQDATCPFTDSLACDSSSKYANLDGSCNNLEVNSYFGKSETPLKRILAPEYSDGISSPKSSDNLPNPRSVSTTLNSDNGNTEAIWTHIYTTFGQFLTHDMVETAVSSVEGVKPECDECTGTDENCMGIEMPSGDVMGIECMSFVRSSPTFDIECVGEERQQLNLLTAFIDGSQVYGNSKAASDNLRSFAGGKLITTSGISSNRDYLPKLSETCSVIGTETCFESGDSRTTENLGLVGMHTLFLREHNRIATELALVNVDWTDETLFQETRRIVGAILQHIVYNQYLPGTIGFQNTDLYGITPKVANQDESTYFTGYDSSVNPQLSNEFATAALRFGHSVVSNEYARYSKDNEEIDTELSFTDINFNSDEAYNSAKGGIDSIVLGLINTVCGKRDISIASDLQNKLIDRPSGPLLDLAAVNIQRGRDHGIPGYTQYVKHCSGIDITSFDDLALLNWGPRASRQIERVYTSVEDIDLWIGLLAENVDRDVFNADVLTGATLTCLLGEQFRDLRDGDRFYYENGPDVGKLTDQTAFTIAQLNEIKVVSLSTILCGNLDVETIQKDVFFVAADRGVRRDNGKVACSDIVQMDLTQWKD